jgi:biotin carboxylase
VPTTTGFALDVLQHPDVAAGRVHTRWLEEELLPSWTPTEEAA